MKFKTFSKDLLTIIVLFFLSIGIGCVVNTFLGDVRSLEYEQPLERLTQDIPISNLKKSGLKKKTNLEKVSLSQLKKLILKANVLVIDVRRDLFFEIGHIPNSINLQEANYQEDKDKYISIICEASDLGKKIVLYCSNIHCPDASNVAKKLIEERDLNIGVFALGWEEWQENVE